MNATERELKADRESPRSVVTERKECQVIDTQLHRSPISCRGSWMSFFRKNPLGHGGDASAPISLRVLSGAMWECAEIFDLHILGSESLREELKPGGFQLASLDGKRRLIAAYQDANVVRIRVEGFCLDLFLREGRGLKLGDSRWTVRANSWSWLSIKTLDGEVAESGDGQGWQLLLDGSSSPTEVLLHRTSHGGNGAAREGTIWDCLDQQARDRESWIRKVDSPGTSYDELRDRELANIWNLVVEPEGNFQRQIVLVSKATLIGLWSWDHCWHMLGTAQIDPTLAWNNLLCMFDHQHESGSLPDILAVNQSMWGYLKPPVHGWMLQMLEERCDWFSLEHRREIYPHIVRLTEFWLTHRMENGLPHYRHGNDSGWDNATIFDEGVPIETPDIATWLILQQEWLGRSAEILGYLEEAERWRRGANELFDRMVNELWTGCAFVGRLTGRQIKVASESLLLRIPLLLGERLTPEMKAWCLGGMEAQGRFRGAGGVYSESTASAYFEGDGYWRGPVWPVATFIVIEGLRCNGLLEEAKDLARDFLDHVEKAGNFENYRSDTGEGVRDPSIAWTSTCVLTLLDDLSKGRFSRSSE